MYFGVAAASIPGNNGHMLDQLMVRTPYTISQSAK
jgi:hypothetical protein